MVEVLNRIRFTERYQALRIQYSFDLEESFEDYDNQHVLEMLQEIGYTSVKYWRKEDFFQAKKKSNIYEFRYHICIKYGVAKLMWWSGKLKLDTEGVENGHSLQYPVHRITSSAQRLSQCRQGVIT